MKKTLLLLVVFLLLGGLTYKYFNSDKANKKSTIAKTSTSFAVENTDEIHKIFLAQMDGQSVLFERKKDHWIFNGKYKAAPNSVGFLLNGIKQLQVQFLPSKNALPKIIKDLSTLGLKVELYNKENEKIKSYIFGGVTQSEEGTYIIMDGGKTPFVATIPHWVGSLRSRFWMTNPMDWRDRTIFKEDVDDIKSVFLEYPKNKDKSFKLFKNGNDYEVTTFYDHTPKITKKMRRGAGEAYLVGYESIIAEAYKNDNPKQDSVKSTIPFVNITLTNVNDEVKKVSLYPIYPKKGPSANFKQIDELKDSPIERYFTTCNDDFLLTQHRVFRELFWGYDSFF